MSELFADDVSQLEVRISECLSRPESLRPFVVSAVANVASYQAIYAFGFASARRWQEWALPYHQRTTGPFSVMYGDCFAGIAAMEHRRRRLLPQGSAARPHDRRISSVAAVRRSRAAPVWVVVSSSVTVVVRSN
ncbi:hypothetical protein ACWEQV_27980 [Rhodococcus aetherivorans]